MLRKMIKPALIGAALIISAPAMAASFVFTGGNSSTFGTLGTGSVFTAGGLTVTATAWSTDSLASNALPEIAYLGKYAGGLGVTNNTEGNGTSLNSHTIDNVGSYDFIKLVFSSAVQLSDITLNAYSVNGGQSTDMDAWVSYGSGAFNTIPTWQSYVATGTAVSSGAGFNSSIFSTQWLIGASRTSNDRDDGFKLAGLTATAAVPEPATWAMMLMGFGGIGFAMRRRSKKRSNTVYA